MELLGTDDTKRSAAIDLGAITASDRIEYWNEVVCANFAPGDNSLHISPHEFTARLHRTHLGPASVCKLSVKPVSCVRDPSILRKKPLDDFFLSYLVRGSAGISQNGRETVQCAGQFLLYDGDRPLNHEVLSDCEGIWVRLPRRLLEGRLSNAEALTARSVSDSTPVGALAASFLIGIANLDLQEEPSASARLLNSLIDILAAALETTPESPFESSHHVNLMDRAKGYLLAKLDDPELKVSDVVQAIGVSRRTLDRLFAVEGTTPTRWMWRQRLERSRIMLESGGCSRTTDVAANCGFKDPAHFSRSFKQEFGVPPGRWRRA